MFEIKNTVIYLKQGDLCHRVYRTKTNLWQELDLFYKDDWHCGDDWVKCQKIVDKERVIEFVAGLNRDLDDARGVQNLFLHY